MGYLTHWHRDALEADDYLVFEPGDKQLQQIGLHLGTLGRVTFSDNDPAPIADYLRQRHGWTVLKPGETALAQHLLAEGYTAFRAGQEPLMADHLTAAGWIVHRNLSQAMQWACRHMRSLGFRIFAPHDPPIVGTLWHATRGASPDRLVLPCEVEGHVAYRNMADCTDHVVVLRTWNGWRTEARARLV